MKSGQRSSCPPRLEPHVPQNTRVPVHPGTRYTRSASSPLSQRKPLDATNPSVTNAAPLCFRHREQWQWCMAVSSLSASYRTFPHRQLPVIACDLLVSYGTALLVEPRPAKARVKTS